MAQLRLLAVALLAAMFLAGCLGPTDAKPHPPPPPPLTTDEITALLARHNWYRNNDNLMVKANPPLPQMIWDADLQAFAQVALDFWGLDELLGIAPPCSFPGTKMSDRMNVWSTCMDRRIPYIGENVAISRNGSANYTAFTAVDMWASAEKYYNMTSGMCRPGKHCSQWTQIAWRGSTSLGCGKITCGSSTEQHAVFACVYGPAGNKPGEKPYEPCKAMHRACPSGIAPSPPCHPPWTTSAKNWIKGLFA